MTLKYCAHPHLVGLDNELPSDPSVAYDGTSPIIGCNHLVCSRCGVVVRHADGCSKTSNHPPTSAVARALYESTDPASSPHLNRGPIYDRSRTYFCLCDWGDATLGGVRSLGSIDAMWDCGGHDDPSAVPRPPMAVVPPAPPAVVPVSRAQVAAPTPRPRPVPIVLPAPAAPPAAPAVARVKLRYPGVNPEFATASELGDCLRASLVAADFYGAPLVSGVHRDDTLPAWGWVVDLIRTRSDWLQPLGIAIEHATRDRGDIARRALADFCAEFTESIALLPWTSKIAASWPDVLASSLSSSRTGWGKDDPRLATIIRDQARFVAARRSPDAVLDGYGKGGKPIRAKLTNEDELRAVLTESARAGRFHHNGSVGPWGWLGLELLMRDEWMWDALVRVVKTIDAEPEISAALDWFSEQRDLWRFQSVLAGWHANPPAWSSAPVTSKPKNWQRKMRVLTWHEPETLGDVARQALWRAVQQHATPPIIDLP